MAPRIAVVGHVEHVTLGRVDAVPRAGDIVHLQNARAIPGGGGALAFAQLARSDAEVHFFTAVGDDDGARLVVERLASRPGVHVHAATRHAPHPRVVVMIDPGGRRTIVVTEEPLLPAASDPLPWHVLRSCDAVYFTGADPAAYALGRAARCLVATARRRHVLAAAGVAADVVVGSATDPRENAGREAYPSSPAALVLTDGARPIRVVREVGTTLVDAPPRVEDPRGDYGAGDSFAGALVYFLACGLSVEEAAARAGPYAAAVLRGVDPLEMQMSLTLPTP
jgi:ribokinase